MRELGVVLLVALAVLAVVVARARLRESRTSLTDPARAALGPGEVGAPSGPGLGVADDALPAGGEPAPSPRPRDDEPPGPDSEAAIAVVDALARTDSGEITREEGLARLRAAAAALAALPPPPGVAPFGVADVLSDVVAGIAATTDTSGVSDPGARRVLDAAAAHDVAALEAPGLDRLFDEVLSLWALWPDLPQRADPGTGEVR